MLIYEKQLLLFVFAKGVHTHAIVSKMTIESEGIVFKWSQLPTYTV